MIDLQDIVGAKVTLEAGTTLFDRWDTLRGVRLCSPGLHVYAAYLPRCPWCPPCPKHKGA